MNRRDLLRRGILAAQKQSVPVKIIVMDDASEDNTTEMIANEFPAVEYHRSPVRKGVCYQRTEGLKVASTEIVFFLDDDSLLQSQFTVEQTLKEFDHPKIGAIAMPYANILVGPEIHTQAPDSKQIYVTFSFVACALALRRRLALDVGGFREAIFIVGEEKDLSIRLLQAGYFVRLGTADPIHHYVSPGAMSPNREYYYRRTDILFGYFNVPLIFLAPYLLATTLINLRHIFFKTKKGWKIQLKGLKDGYRAFFERFPGRSPVSVKCFLLHRSLKKRGCVPMSDIYEAQ